MVRTREPGGSPVAEEVRALLAGARAGDWDGSVEAFLLSAARFDHCRRTIGPALRRGAWVVSDRFVDSLFAYQECGRFAPGPFVRLMAEHSVGGLMPDLTVICDVDVDTAHDRVVRRTRLSGGTLACYERADRPFRQRVRAGFHERAWEDPDRCVVVDTAAPRETVAARIWSAICDRLEVQDG